jgi:hypothetical protein
MFRAVRWQPVGHSLGEAEQLVGTTMSEVLRVVTRRRDVEPLRFPSGFEEELIEVFDGERSREQEALSRVDVFGLEA